jgi:glycerol-3-phosphate cytidylyltransferase
MEKDKQESNVICKYEVGYTTGTFDLFHVGHLNLLENAKKYCNILIVGVSTDELVQSYKGVLPIIPFEDRIRIIEALKCVDKAIPQTSMNKLVALERIHYDVLFHGDDWKNTELYNDIENKLKEKGIPCIYFPYTTNVSSREIRKKIEEKRGKKE